MIKADPHGIVELFASRLNANLEIMKPEDATKDATSAVRGFIDASDFIDVTTKDSVHRQFLRVWKREEGK